MDDNGSRRFRRKVIPWWVHLLLAILSYGLLKYGPAAFPGDASGPLAALADKAAPIVAIGFLLFAANSIYAKDPPKNKEDDDDAAGTG